MTTTAERPELTFFSNARLEDEYGVSDNGRYGGAFFWHDGDVCLYRLVHPKEDFDDAAPDPSTEDEPVRKVDGWDCVPLELTELDDILATLDKLKELMMREGGDGFEEVKEAQTALFNVYQGAV